MGPLFKQGLRFGRLPPSQHGEGGSNEGDGRAFFRIGGYSKLIFREQFNGIAMAKVDKQPLATGPGKKSYDISRWAIALNIEEPLAAALLSKENAESNVFVLRAKNGFVTDDKH